MAAADSFIQVAIDGTGKKVDNTAVTTDAGAVQRQGVGIADPNNNYRAPVDPYVGLSVNDMRVRQLDELNGVSAMAAASMSATRYGRERVSLPDARGRFDSRGMR